MKTGGTTVLYILVGIGIAILLSSIAQVYAQENTLEFMGTIETQLPAEEVLPIKTEKEIIIETLYSAVDLIDVDTIIIEQEKFFGLENEYLQVKGADSNVNVYESPDGWGYQVVFIDKLGVQYVGYGPKAEDYTYSKKYLPPSGSFSSTTIRLLNN